MTPEKDLKKLIRNDQLDAYIEQSFAELCKTVGLHELVPNLVKNTDIPADKLLDLFKSVFSAGTMYGAMRGAYEMSHGIIRGIEERMGGK